jgi:hypothetical protein
MPVDTQHQQYKHYYAQWDKCIAVREGEEVIKLRGTDFLPKLDKQKDQQYTDYKTRAMFYNAVERTVQGLTGAVFAKMPIFHIDSEEDQDFFDSLTLDRTPFIDLAKAAFTDVLCPSRVGLFADVPIGDADGNEAYLVMYDALSIINWREDVINGKLTLTQVVLHENITVDGDDEFDHDTEEQWRVLELVYLNERWVYQQRIFRRSPAPETRDKFILINTIYPTKHGVPLDHIPFVIINPTKIGARVEKPICIDMVNVNLSHFRSSADLEHGRHFTGLPTAWVAGFDPKRAELTIGSSMAWVSANPNAHAGYLEFTGQGLSTLENALRDKEKLLTILGARILEGQKDAVENAETQKVRRLGENSILANIADTVGMGLTIIVQEIADWRGKIGRIRIELNKEYTSIKVDAPTITAVMGLLQNGAMSYDTFFYNLKQWQMVPTERTIEDELNLIEARKSAMGLTTNTEQKPKKKAATDVTEEPEEPEDVDMAA